MGASYTICHVQGPQYTEFNARDMVTFCLPFCFPSSFLKPQELLFGERYLASQGSSSCRRRCWNWWLNYGHHGCCELAAEKKSWWKFTHKISNTTPKLHTLTPDPQSTHSPHSLISFTVHKCRPLLHSHLPTPTHSAHSHSPQTYTPSTLPQLTHSSHTYTSSTVYILTPPPLTHARTFLGAWYQPQEGPQQWGSLEVEEQDLHQG